MELKRLAIITTHPIQYNAPLFKLLSERNKIMIKVFYTWEQSFENKVFDPGFNTIRSWDIPLLEGYQYEFVKNVSSKPGSHHFMGIVTPNLITTINDWKPDFLLVLGWSFYSHLAVIRYFKGKIPVYFRGDSTLLDEYNKFSVKKTVRRVCLKFIYKYIDKAFYTGTNNKEYYLKHGLKTNQLVYAPHSIDNIRFSKEGNKQNLRQKLGISDIDKIILFAGKFEKKKNPLLLIQAFKNIENKNLHLVLVGNGKLENDIFTEATSIHNIHILPFQNQSQMPDVYTMADVFVLPSKGPGETWGLAINEAMASRKAVLASDKCGCSVDLIQNNINGYVFESDNLSDLEEKLELCIQNCETFGVVSQKIIKDWSLERTANCIEEELLLN